MHAERWRQLGPLHDRSSVTARVADAIMMERLLELLQEVVTRCSSACCTSLPGSGIGVSAAWLERSALSACWKSNCIATFQMLFLMTLARSRRLYVRPKGRAGVMALSVGVVGRLHNHCAAPVKAPLGSDRLARLHFAQVRDSKPNEPPFSRVRLKPCRHISPCYHDKSEENLTIESHQCGPRACSMLCLVPAGQIKRRQL